MRGGILTSKESHSYIQTPMFHHGVHYDNVALDATEQYLTVRAAVAPGSLTRFCQT